MDFAFVQKRYEDELVRKDKIRDAIAAPISAIIVLGGLIAAMARGYSYPTDAKTAVFVTFVVAAAMALTVCLYNFFNAFQSQPYKEIGPLSAFHKTEADLAVYYRKLAAFHQRKGDTVAADQASKADIGEEFKKRVVAQMIEFTDFNQVSNLAKTRYLERGIDILWLLLVFTLIIAFPFVLDQAYAPSRPQVVHIDNLPVK